MVVGLVSVLASLSGCANLPYYAQSVRGQLQIFERERPIATVLDDPAVSKRVKVKLRQVRKFRRFAVSALALPDNGSYRQYADLQRPLVVWNVFATPELSLTPVKSCFLVVGCLNYRGYFHETDARAFANKLRKAGDDVFLGGVAAYSTLGWFDDPVLNTMLRWDDGRIARFIFHELAHQRLYIRDDSDFNEAFATAVANEGWRRWLKASGDATPSSSTESTHDAEFTRLLLHTRSRLESIYNSGRSDAFKRAAKAAAFKQLLADYGVLRRRWGSDKGYDHWMHHDLNNAKIAAVSTYHADVPAFMALLAAAGGDMAKFYQLTAAVGGLPLKARRHCQDGLLRSGAAYLDACALPQSKIAAHASH